MKRMYLAAAAIIGVFACRSVGIATAPEPAIESRVAATFPATWRFHAGEPATFAGLAGMGDLIATCTSPLSRNRTFGFNLGRGMTPAEAESAMRQTCEGVKSCRPILVPIAFQL